MREKIALWGYGKLGRRMEQDFLRLWPEEYEITAVFDRNCGGTAAGTGLVIEDPEKMGERFAQGVFDGVFPAMSDLSRRREMEAVLKEQEIPVIVPDNRSRFFPAETFELARQPSVRVERDGYDFHVLNGIRLFRPFYDTKCYLFDGDGRVVGDLFTPAHYMDEPRCMSFRADPDPDRYPVREIEGDVFLAARVWSGNYWHFLYESMDQIWLMEKAGFTGRYIVPDPPYISVLTDLLGISGDRLIRTSELGCETVWRFERLYLLQLRHASPRDSAPVLAEMAEKLLAGLPENGKTYPERLFLKRIGSRRLLEAESFLEKYGFETIVPEDLSVEEQIRHFAHAKIVLCPHGAGSANSLFMQPGAALIETFPTSWLNPCCLETCQARGIWYFQVVETMFQARQRRIEGQLNRDYSVPAAALELAMRNALALTGSVKEEAP